MSAHPVVEREMRAVVADALRESWAASGEHTTCAWIGCVGIDTLAAVAVAVVHDHIEAATRTWRSRCCLCDVPFVDRDPVAYPSDGYAAHVRCYENTRRVMDGALPVPGGREETPA